MQLIISYAFAQAVGFGYQSASGTSVNAFATRFGIVDSEKPPGMSHERTSSFA